MSTYPLTAAASARAARLLHVGVLPTAYAPLQAAGSGTGSGFVQATTAVLRCNGVMSSQTLTARGPSRSPSAGPDAGSAASVLKLGAVVSVIQSALFVVIGVAGLVLGAGRLVDHGFAGLAVADPAAFRVLCVAFVAIAVLGLAITAAERP